MEKIICQSCGMPMDRAELYGDNADGTKNKEYCMYCYKQGAFTKEETMEEMIETCIPFMLQQGMKEQEARNIMNNLLPTLKRWKIA